MADNDWWLVLAFLGFLAFLAFLRSQQPVSPVGVTSKEVEEARRLLHGRRRKEDST